MVPRVVVVLLLLTASVVCLYPAVAQDDNKAEKPRFFFEKDKPPKPDAEADEPAVVPAKPEAEAAPLAPAAPDFRFEAAEELGVWHALDAEAVLDLATEAGAANAGKGCLRLTYVPREGVFEQLSAQPLVGQEAGTLSFSIKTDFPTNLSFGVVERGGAFYQQFAATPADKWVRVSVPLTSLLLAQDTPDQTGKLEPASIIELRFADLANLPGALGDALGRKTSVQRLFLDDVALSDEAAPPVADAGPDGLLVDDFERQAIHALAIGDAQLSRVPDGDGHALAAVCDERVQRWMGFVMAVGHLDLRPAEALSLKLRASQPLVLNVTLEEWDNSKYSQRVAVPQAEDWTEKTIPLDGLLLEVDSDDENGQLDRDQIRVLVIVADVARTAQFPVSFGVDDVAFE